MTKAEVVVSCVNEQLKIAGYHLTYDDVKNGSKFSTFVIKKPIWFGLWYKKIKVPWYQYFTFDSKEQFEEWRNFCIKQIMRYTNKSKIAAENEFAWINLAYGLKQNYKND